MAEEWRPIKGAQGYSVSSIGRVRRDVDGLVLSVNPRAKNNPYLAVGLRINGRKTCHSVHRLVAEAFCSKPEGKDVVHHKDGNKTNNASSNLEWVTPSENAKHSAKNRHTPSERMKIAIKSRQRKVVVVETGKVYESVEACARDIGGWGGNITHCLKGRRRSHKGYHFEYVDEVKNG